MEFYRYEDSKNEAHIKVNCIKYHLVKETKKGYWVVEDIFPIRKWVSKSSKKRLCYPTKQEAWESYIYRKKAQFSILEKNFRIAKARKEYVEKHQEAPVENDIVITYNRLFYKPIRIKQNE